MGEIRPFDECHIPAVAALELKVFHRRTGAAGPALRKYFADVFLCNPWRDAELPSLVYISKGKVTGFLGVIPRPMVFEDRAIRVAVASQFMADPEERGGFAGVELLRRFLRGPQDLSYTDGATEAACAVWTALGARVARLYSLQWRRVLRPARCLELLLEQQKRSRALRLAARLMRPAGAAVDALSARLPFRACAPPQTPFRSQSAKPHDLLACIGELGANDTLRPCYEPASFQWLLAQAAAAKPHGALRSAIVRSPEGRLAGWYIYYAKRGGVSKVLQIGAANHSFDAVFLALLRDAREQGSAAVAGQAIPHRLLNLSNQFAALSYIGNGVLIHSRNPEIRDCILKGEAALSRLDGEWWLRFAVEEWE